MVRDHTEPIPVECNECEKRPQLVETPYTDAEFQVVCDCGYRGIDVTDSVVGNSLMHPLNGQWSTLDHHYEIWQDASRE